MNERIEELTIAYLHKGSTPEQEQELFDACKENPEISEYLRQHLILSLKLRQLRDKTEVPLEARNAVISAINAIHIDDAAPARKYAPVAAPRFGWRHVFGSALATAALSAALFFSLKTENPTQQSVAQAVSIHDTLCVLQVDTVTQVREIQKPVYIARNEPAPVTAPDRLNPDVSSQVDVSSIDLDKNIPVQPKTVSPKLLDTVTMEQGHLAAQDDASSYLEYYKSMLSTLKIVHITPSDRIRN